jgi:dUTP pyrophosphatase
MAGEKGDGTPAPVVRIRGKEPGVVLPVYETEGASGMDLRAFMEGDITIPPLGRARIPTGLFMEIPVGYEAQVRPRSGLAARWGVTVLNSPGTIDSDYRGELEVILINLGSDAFTVKSGDRIAQMVIAPVLQVKTAEAASLSGTGRGAGGFGSTGV